MSIFADRFKAAARRLMDDITLIQGTTETATRGCYEPSFRSPVVDDGKPSSPAVTGFGEDFPGLKRGNQLRINGHLFDVTDIFWDRPTDEITIELKRRA